MALKCELMLECEVKYKDGKVRNFDFNSTGAYAKKIITYRTKEHGYQEFEYDTCISCLDMIKSLEEAGDLEIMSIRNLKTGKEEYNVISDK